MKNNKGFAPIVLVLIVIGILAIGGNVYYARKSSTPALQGMVDNNYQLPIDQGNTTDITPVSNFGAPIISKISGPQTLDRNQQGTWVVVASDLSGGNLLYSVRWGDEGNGYLPGEYQTSATFTHSFSTAFIYPINFSVINSAGQTAEISLNVTVGNVITIPQITSIFPNSGPIGTQITVKGNGFSPTDNSVSFGGAFSTSSYYFSNLNSSDDKTITFIVPALSIIAKTKIQPGVYEIFARNGFNNTQSNSVYFTVTN